MDWHRKEIDETLRSLNSGTEGLSSQEASDRLEKYGPNELKEMIREVVLECLEEERNRYRIPYNGTQPPAVADLKNEPKG